MPMYWTFNCFLGCIYTVYHIVYIVFLVLNWLSNLEFWSPKKEDQVARIRVMGGGLGDSGNARKKTFFFNWGLPLVTISRHPPQPDMEEPVSGNLFFKTKHLSRTKPLPSHIHEKIWPRSTQFWLGFLGFSSILEVTFWDTPILFLVRRGYYPKSNKLIIHP